tara:strand:+ start:2644 stop:3354 length:711 start_codon:yes stop_codon:yes gene_type:complete
MNRYLSYSKDLLTSILFISPFIILYETLCYFIFINKDYEIRNLADVFIRDRFYILGEISQLFYVFILISAVIIYVIYNYDKYESYSFSVFYSSLMIIEGFALSLILLFIINGFSVFESKYNFSSNPYFINFYSSVGAGIWEEVFFRLFLFGFISYILRIFFGNEFFSIFFALIISSIFFSLFHYIGNLGELFAINTFIIRFVAGVLLCLIYIKRGLGIACITHILYDVMLFTIPLI